MELLKSESNVVVYVKLKKSTPWN